MQLGEDKKEEKLTTTETLVGSFTMFLLGYSVLLPQ